MKKGCFSTISLYLILTASNLLIISAIVYITLKVKTSLAPIIVISFLFILPITSIITSIKIRDSKYPSFNGWNLKYTFSPKSYNLTDYDFFVEKYSKFQLGLFFFLIQGNFSPYNLVLKNQHNKYFHLHAGYGATFCAGLFPGEWQLVRLQGAYETGEFLTDVNFIIKEGFLTFVGILKQHDIEMSFDQPFSFDFNLNKKKSNYFLNEGYDDLLSLLSCDEWLTFSIDINKNIELLNNKEIPQDIIKNISSNEDISFSEKIVNVIKKDNTWLLYRDNEWYSLNKKPYTPNLFIVRDNNILKVYNYCDYKTRLYLEQLVNIKNWKHKRKLISRNNIIL